MGKVKDWGGFSIACRGATPASLTVSSSSPRTLLSKTHPWLPLPVRRPHLLQVYLVLTRPHLSLDLNIPGFKLYAIKLWACRTGSLVVHFPTSPQEGKFRDHGTLKKVPHNLETILRKRATCEQLTTKPPRCLNKVSSTCHCRETVGS